MPAQWPSPGDYSAAIQNPQNCFNDPELRCGKTAVNQHGLPAGASGNFAVVYQLTTAKRALAARCFIRPVTDQQKRYEELSRYLSGFSLRALVDFAYLLEGIRVRGHGYPLLRMEWVAGQQLHRYVAAHLHRADDLKQLASRWRGVIAGLRGAHAAHGDLQHGNVLIDASGHILLVDYDGFFIPALRGHAPGEVGHPNYQHPERIAYGFYEESADNFSALVVYLSLLALRSDPRLWDLHNGENLVLAADDFKRPANSAVWLRLKANPDSEVRKLTGQLEAFCRDSVASVPDLEEVIQGLPRKAVVAGTATGKTPSSTTLPGLIVPLVQKLDQIRVVVSVAFADGVLSPEEEKEIRQLGSKLQVPSNDIDRIIRDERRKHAAPLPQPRSSSVAAPAAALASAPVAHPAQVPALPPPPSPKPKSKAAKILGAIVVIWLSLVLLGRLVSYLQRQSPPSPPLQVGIVSTATGVTGWRNYASQNTFRPGEFVYFYAEALNINHGGRADVSFTFRVTGPNGASLPEMTGRYATQTADPSCFDWGKAQLPAETAPGTYVAQVDIRDNLANQAVQAQTQFTVAPIEHASANPTGASNIDGAWHGTSNDYNPLLGATSFDLQIKQSGTQFSGSIQEKGPGDQKILSDITGQIDGSNIQFVKTYRENSERLTYTGNIGGDGSTINGSWSGWGHSGGWSASRELSAAEPNSKTLGAAGAQASEESSAVVERNNEGTANTQSGYLTIHTSPPGTVININNGLAQFSGEWSDNPWPPGTYTITASAKSMKTETRTVALKAGQHATVEFNLSAEPDTASAAEVIPSTSIASRHSPEARLERPSTSKFDLQLAGASQLYGVAVSLLARPDTTYLFIYWSNSGGNQLVKLNDISKIEIKHRTLEFNAPSTLFQFGIGGPKVYELVLEVRDEHKKKFAYHFVSKTVVCRVGSPCQEGTDGGQGLRDLATAIQAARNGVPSNN